jgi:hypothetical protein
MLRRAFITGSFFLQIIVYEVDVYLFWVSARTTVLGRPGPVANGDRIIAIA